MAKIYLVGGGDIVAGELKVIDSEAISNAENKSIYILDLTSNDKKLLAKYRGFLTSYFKEIGAKDVNFISESNSRQDIKRNFNNSGTIYLPGGNTETLLQNVKEKELVSLVKSFEGVIIGNSAGALVLCKDVVLTKDEDVKETKVLDGVGLVDFGIDVHYDNSHDEELLELCNKRKIYGIPERSVVMINNGKLDFKGKIYEFNRGKKVV